MDFFSGYILVGGGDQQNNFNHLFYLLFVDLEELESNATKYNSLNWI
jgi:hypothetical protein